MQQSEKGSMPKGSGDPDGNLFVVDCVQGSEKGSMPKGSGDRLL